MNINTEAVPVTAEPAPLEVREVVHRLSRNYPTAKILAGQHGEHFWSVTVFIQGVYVFQEKVYPGFAQRLAAALDSEPARSSWYEAEGEPRVDSQWDEREAG